MSSDQERAVRAANRAFYEAFDRHDFTAMEALWARDSEVWCVHPGWDLLKGRPAVLRAWRLIFQGPRPPRVRVDEGAVCVQGKLALVVCHESLRGSDGSEAGTLVATNAFVCEDDGAWRLVHHHASPSINEGDEGEDDEDSDDEVEGDDSPREASGDAAEDEGDAEAREDLEPQREALRTPSENEIDAMLKRRRPGKVLN